MVHVLDSNSHKAAMVAYCHLVQQLIGGPVKRNVFTQWEMLLLLDLQMTPMRKSSRPEVLKRYLRAVEQQMTDGGAAAPLRFADFFERDPRARRVAPPTAQRTQFLQAS